MALKKTITSAILFLNGGLAVFDIEGKQVGELQGNYSIDKHKRILLEASDNCEFKGFEILPSGFVTNAKIYADYWRKQNMSWEDIQNV